MNNYLQKLYAISSLFLILAGLPACSVDPEKDLVPAFSPENSPYNFTAYFINARNDTTARYKLQLTVIGEKSNIEGEDGSYSISFNSADITYNTRWEVTSLGLPADTFKYDGKLNKDKKSITLEMPQTGVFAPLKHTLDITASATDTEGKVYNTTYTGYGKDEKDLQQKTSVRKVKKVDEQDWYNSKINTWTYEAVTQQGTVNTKEVYRFSPTQGILSVIYDLPLNEKITILQVPKNEATEHK